MPLRMPWSKTCCFVTARSKWIWPANRPLVQAVARAGSLASLFGSKAKAVALWVGPGTEGYFSNLKIAAK